MKAVSISTDGEHLVVEYEPTDEGGSLKVLQTAVNGYIECIHLKNYEVDMWVNEEGKINQLPQNPYGTALWAENYGLSDYTAGNIIITGKPDVEGYSTSLTDEQVEFFMNYDEAVILAHVGKRLCFLGVIVDVTAGAQ